MLIANVVQWGAALFEWGTTWLLIQKDGKVYKEDLRAVYDVGDHSSRLSWVFLDEVN